MRTIRCDEMLPCIYDGMLYFDFKPTPDEIYQGKKVRYLLDGRDLYRFQSVAGTEPGWIYICHKGDLLLVREEAFQAGFNMKPQGH